MLSLKNINDITSRIGLEDFSTDIVNLDQFGDMITVFDPDTDFVSVRGKVLANPVLFKKITSSSPVYVEYEDLIWDNGNQVKVGILINKGQNGFGTNIKVMVKSLKVSVNGEIKNFLGFEAYSHYLSLASNLE